MEFLATPIFGNTLERWLIAAGVALLSFAVFIVARRLVARRLRRLAERTSTDVDDLVVDMLRRTKRLLLLVISIDIAAASLVLPPAVVRVLDSATVIAVLMQVALWGNQVVTYLIARQLRQRAEGGLESGSLGALGFLIRLVLWAVVLLLALENLGVDVTALIAGLGIGGIAIALAAQNILGDLFASLSIVIDRPFVVGDVITVDTFTGTVEHVGLKTTRVRSISGEQVIFSNTDLLASRIRNFKRMEERRILFSVGVVYGTPPGTLRRIPELIRGIIESVEGVRFDRAHFKEFGPSSLNFEVVYYVTAPEYPAYMEVNQRIMTELYACFVAEGIEFAFPTQTVHLAPPPPSQRAAVESVAPLDTEQRS